MSLLKNMAGVSAESGKPMIFSTGGFPSASKTGRMRSLVTPSTNRLRKSRMEMPGVFLFTVTIFLSAFTVWVGMVISFGTGKRSEERRVGKELGLCGVCV